MRMLCLENSEFILAWTQQGPPMQEKVRRKQKSPGVFSQEKRGSRKSCIWNYKWEKKLYKGICVVNRSRGEEDLVMKWF